MINKIINDILDIAIISLLTINIINMIIIMENINKMIVWLNI